MTTDSMDVNSQEAALWSETMRLKSENEFLLVSLRIAGQALDRAVAETGLSGEPMQWLRLASEQVRAALGKSVEKADAR